MNIDLQDLRTNLARQIEAIDLLTGAGGRVSTSALTRATRRRQPGRKRKMSAAWRAKIAAAARKRWAKARAAGRNRL